MSKIFKYQLDDAVESQFIVMPAGSTVLTVQVQDGGPFLWVKVDPVVSLVKRRFLIFGTGYEIVDPDQLHYVGTYQMRGGLLVWHVFTDRVEYPLSKY